MEWGFWWRLSISWHLFQYVCMYIYSDISSAYNYKISFDIWILSSSNRKRNWAYYKNCLPPRQCRDPRFPQPSNLAENSFSELAKVFSKFSCSERLVPTPTQVSDLGFSTPSSHHTPPIHCSNTQALTLLKSWCLVFPHNYINLPSQHFHKSIA